MLVNKLMRGKNYILPILLLIGLFAFDIVSLMEQPSKDCYESAKTIIHQILEEESKALLSSDLKAIYNKKDLEIVELNLVQNTTARLRSKKVEARLNANGRSVFWTKNFSDKDFCTTIKGDINGKICYAPFDSDGEIKATHLQEMGFHHYFHRDNITGKYNILDVSISMGERFRHISTEYLLLAAYMILLIWILMLSLHLKHFFPLAIALGVRIASIHYGWMERFTIVDTLPSFASNGIYHPLDLMYDGVLILCLIIFITEKFIIAHKDKLSTGVMVGLSVLHMLMFISHIRFIQLLVRNDISSRCSFLA